MTEIFHLLGSFISQILSLPLPYFPGLTVGGLIFAFWSIILGGKIVRLVFGADTSFLIKNAKDGK